MKRHLFVLGAALISGQAFAQDVTVKVTNLAPNGGVYLTPMWVGFHNGSFDSYDGGTASAAELERLAEDGNTAPLSAVFNANSTLVATSVSQAGTRQDETLGDAPFGPGRDVTSTFSGLELADANRYFSYASMILPSSDYYVANGNPTVYDLSTLAEGETRRIFIYGTRTDNGRTNVNDAGTEVNDFSQSAGNGFFPGLTSRGAAGQSGPDQGAAQGGVNANVTSGQTANNPFENFDEGANNGAGFLNAPAGFDFVPLNFNDPAIYTGRGQLSTAQQGNIPAIAVIEISREAVARGGGGSLGWFSLLALALVGVKVRRAR